MAHASAEHSTPHGSLRAYTVGFILSLGLTCGAYLSVANHIAVGNALLGIILGLAVLQLIVQLVFFLHLSRESGTRWNLIAFLFMGLVVFILVGGSLWIMYHLNYNMTPDQINAYTMDQEGIHK